MNLSTIDLNLLVVLHEVLTQKSATMAAKRLGVTQSAVSNALARLRELIRDPLVVRSGRGLAVTPKGEALRLPLAKLLGDVGALLAREAEFDPLTTKREFILACADYYGMVVLPSLTSALRERAPFATLRIISLERLVSYGGLADDVDLHVGRPPSLLPGCHSAPLFHEQFVCLTRRTAKTAPAKMGLREYAAASHVRVQVLDNARDPIDEGLKKYDVTRSIAVTVPHFSLAPWVVLRTGYVATLSSRLAHLYASYLPLVVRAAPIRLKARPVQMIWHERTANDLGARFFRDLVTEVSKT